MEYTVNSLKDAIDISLDKYGYDKTNINLIRKFIESAIAGQSNYFTRNNGARSYVDKNIHNNGILNEIKRCTKLVTGNVSEIIDEYIKKFFKQNEELRETIHNNSNISKITQKIRYLNSISVDDREFMSNIWNSLIKAFMGEDKSISKEEIRYDMLEAALNSVDECRSFAAPLRHVDLNSNDLSSSEAFKLIEEYVYFNNYDEINKAINNNQSLSGLLLQNLIDYSYFKQNKMDNKNSLLVIDNKLKEIVNIKTRANMLFKILNNDMDEDLNIERNELIIGLLKNTLLLNIYSRNNNSVDYAERKLYSGVNILDENSIHNRIETNNKIANNLIINGRETSVEDIENYINSLTFSEKYFLVNMYAVSRSLKENVDKIDMLQYYGSAEQLHVLNLLESFELKESLKNNKRIK